MIVSMCLFFFFSLFRKPGSLFFVYLRFNNTKSHCHSFLFCFVWYRFSFHLYARDCDLNMNVSFLFFFFYYLLIIIDNIYFIFFFEFVLDKWKSFFFFGIFFFTKKRRNETKFVKKKIAIKRFSSNDSKTITSVVLVFKMPNLRWKCIVRQAHRLKKDDDW